MLLSAVRVDSFISQPLSEQLDSWLSKALLECWNLQNLNTLGSRLGACKVGLSVSSVFGCFRVSIWTSQSKDPWMGKGAEAPLAVQSWGWESDWSGKAHTGLCLGGVMGLPTLPGTRGLSTLLPGRCQRHPVQHTHGSRRCTHSATRYCCRSG